MVGISANTIASECVISQLTRFPHPNNSWIACAILKNALDEYDEESFVTLSRCIKSVTWFAVPVTGTILSTM